MSDMASPGTAAIDLALLREFVGDDEADVRNFLERFFARLKGDMVELRRLACLHQWANAGRQLHNMKSSAAAIGAVGLVAGCVALEQLAGESDEKKMQAVLDAINHSFAAVGVAVGDVFSALNTAIET